MEAQLVQSTKQLENVTSKGDTLTAKLAVVDKKLQSAGVVVDKSLTVHTSKTLKGEFDQLKDILVSTFTALCLTI